MYYKNPDGVSVHEGFPNPASDTSLQSLDLNSLLINHRSATYFMRLQGDDWKSLGLLAGDIVIVDRAIPARPNDVVVCVKSDSFIISHLSDIDADCSAWGVVTAAIHMFRRATNASADRLQ